MEITGSLAIGNGEKCPFCEEILDDRVEGKEILPHIEKYHKEELIKKLFPKPKPKRRKNMEVWCDIQRMLGINPDNYEEAIHYCNFTYKNLLKLEEAVKKKLGI